MKNKNVTDEMVSLTEQGMKGAGKWLGTLYKNHKGFVIMMGCLIVVAIVAGIALSVSGNGSTVKEVPMSPAGIMQYKIDTYPGSIYGVVEDAVKTRLSFPEEASFEKETPLKITDVNKSEGETSGEVVSKNAFGVKVRFHFKARFVLFDKSASADVIELTN